MENRTATGNRPAVNGSCGDPKEIVMNSAETGLAVSTFIVLDPIDQTPTVSVTYDAANNTCTCDPQSVTLYESNSGTISVGLALVNGTGNIVFDKPPIAWVSTPPNQVTVYPPDGGVPLITITDPNRTSGAYAFRVNYVYTPITGDPVRGQGDPTIINEGTGTSPA
jgi:hypothetical protein